jgi:hypothetical protein
MPTRPTLSRTGLTIAIVVSLLAIPLLWWAGATDQTVVLDDGPTAVTTPNNPATDALGTLSGAFVSAEEIPQTEFDQVPPAAREPGQFVIAVPRTRTNTASGWATFRSTLPSVEVCAVRNVPFGSEVRVTNTNNGRSLQCRASVSTFGSDAEVIVHTDAFSRIALLGSAPIPVQIDW